MDYAEIYNTPHGEKRLELIKLAYEEADQRNDFEDRINWRLEYLDEADFYVDPFRMFLVYPELLKISDEHYKETGWYYRYFEILWDYKWVLEHCQNFYQISVEQFENMAEDFKKRCLEANYSLDMYYYFKFSFHKNTDFEKAEAYYQEYLKQPRTRLSDCHACARNAEVSYLLHKGDLERAKDRARPLLMKTLTCKEMPGCTYGNFVYYYVENLLAHKEVEIEDIQQQAMGLRHFITYKQVCLDYVGILLMYYSICDRGKALAWFKKYYNFLDKVYTPMFKFYFELGMMLLLKKNIDKKEYKMKLPKDYKFYQETDRYDIAMLYDYYKKSALEYAQKIDARNGNDHNSRLVDLVERYEI